MPGVGQHGQAIGNEADIHFVREFVGRMVATHSSSNNHLLQLAPA